MEEPEQVEWLPPQAAGAAAPPQFSPAAVDPRWPPPTAAAPPAPRTGGSTETWSLVLGIAGLVAFVFPAGFGLVFLFNLPASIAAWVLGARARPRTTPGLVLGIVGVVLGVLAIVGWALAIALSEEVRDELSRAVEEGRE